MKYLKISSLLVLSLLLFAPGAWADMECELESENTRLRGESRHESLGTLTVECSWENADTIADTDTFTLELEFSADISNDDDMYVELWLMDGPGGVAATDDPPENQNRDGNRSPAPRAEVGRDYVLFEDVVFPATWADEDEGEFTITGIHVDATSADDVRLEAAVDMDSNTDAGFDADDGPVRVGRVERSLELEIADIDDNDAFKIDSCNPDEHVLTVRLVEGFDAGWSRDNEILLSISSGTIDSDGTRTFEVDIDRSTDFELVLGVREDDNVRDSANLKITFQPDAGVNGDELILTAQLLRARGTDEEFEVSDRLTVGTYDACTGDTITFPFLSNRSGFDTGVALINMSDDDGECELLWDGMEARSGSSKDVFDVDAMETTVFVLSMENPEFQGYLKAMCTFNDSYGYAFITDVNDTRSGAQGYYVKGGE